MCGIAVRWLPSWVCTEIRQMETIAHPCGLRVRINRQRVHGFQVVAVAWDPSGVFLASASLDATVQARQSTVLSTHRRFISHGAGQHYRVQPFVPRRRELSTLCAAELSCLRHLIALLSIIAAAARESQPARAPCACHRVPLQLVNVRTWLPIANFSSGSAVTALQASPSGRCSPRH